MGITQTIIVICWALFLFYWFINWRNVKPTKVQKFNTIKIRGIIVVIIIVLLLNRFVFDNVLYFHACQWQWIGCHFHVSTPVIRHSLPIQIISVIFSIVGLVIAIVARRTLAGNWSPSLDVKQGHELITGGVYHFVRHPIYSGLLLMLLGTLVAFQTDIEVIVFIAVTLTVLYRIRREEALMTQIFPKAYPAYKKRTKALIPFVW